MRKLFEYGGAAAGVILLAFGIAALVMGSTGLGTVRSNLEQEQIYFGDAAKDPTVPQKYSNQLVDNGTEARAFAEMMRGHTLAQTDGKTYAQMGRFLAANGKGDDGLGGTNDPAQAVIDPKTGNPTPNPTRNVWVTETALATALNTAYMAERISTFGVVVGIALLLTGVGFLVLALGGALRRRVEATAAAPTAPVGEPILE